MIQGEPRYLSIAQNETDYWLRSFVIALSAAANHLPKPELAELGQKLDAITSKLPLTPFDVEVSLAQLEKVLSLPIWEKRHELYSVWIATEMVRALDEDGHQVELHHEKGRIAFAFHETLIATVHSSPGPFTLVSELRSPLLNPQGEGRTAGVQPDHALWTKERGKEICRMVVEAKHYKKSAKGKFQDVFEDYARAFPQAEVYLVNHGPPGKSSLEISSAVRDRCHPINELTSIATEAKNELAKAIRQCVGQPIAAWPVSHGGTTDTVVAIDVSGSMRPALSLDEMEALIRQLIAKERPSELVAIASTVVSSWPPTKAGFTGLIAEEGDSTALALPVDSLLKRAKRVVIVTDQGGFDTLPSTHRPPQHYDIQAPKGVVVCAIDYN